MKNTNSHGLASISKKLMVITLSLLVSLSIIQPAKASQMSSLSGVVSSGGVPVAGVPVVFYGAGFSTSVRSDSDGAYSFLLSPGSGSLMVSGWRFPGFSQVQGWRFEKTINISDGGVSQNFDVRLPVFRNVKIKVVDSATGDLISDAAIQISGGYAALNNSWKDANGWQSAYTYPNWSGDYPRTDANGEAIIRVPDTSNIEQGVQDWQVSVIDPNNSGRVAISRIGEVTEDKTITMTLPSQFAGSEILPTISGDVVVDHDVTVNPGVWAAGVQVSYQWYLNGVAIAGAVSKTYRPVGSDVGRELSVVVSGSVNGASLNLRSVSAGVIAPTALTQTPKPSVQGITSAGQIVTANTGVWDQGVAFSYQWLRDGVAISGAQSATYKLSGLDTGHKVAVSVTATKQGYFDKTLVSEPVTVGVGTQNWLQEPQLIGEGRVASSLTVKTASEYPASFKYQWFKDGKPVVGAISDTYTFNQKDLGSTYSVTTRSIVPGFNDAIFTSKNIVVAAGTLAQVVGPSVSGFAKVGSVLSGNPGVWPSGAKTTMQWLRDGSPIAAATKNSYLLTPADAGHQISFQVTASLKAFVNGIAVVKTGPIELGEQTGSLPTVSGAVLFGQRLKVSAGPWTKGSALSYQWLANGQDINGATSTSLVLSDALVGKTIQVRVTGRQDGYRPLERLSTATPVVTGGLLTIGSPSINDAYQTGSTVTVNPGNWGDGVTLTYQWFRGKSLISGQSGPSKLLTPADISFKLSVIITASKANYTTVVTKALVTKTIIFGK